MGFVLPKPKALRSGALTARQVIPADVREEYQRLYGKAWEERWRADPGMSTAEQKQSYAGWYAEIWKRFDAIRSAKRGDAIELTRTEAAALAGEWYAWFVARHEENPGKPQRWESELWWFVDELQRFAPDEVRAEPMRDLEWTRDPEIRAGIRPIVADVGHTTQFLTSRGIALTSRAQSVFLDFVVDGYVDALSLLERRARNDYTPDDTAQAFPKFSLPQRRSSDGQSPRKLYEAWAAARKPAASTISRWNPVFDDLEVAFSGPNAQPLTDDTAQAWAVEKRTDERSAATVKDVWVNAAATVYQWGKDQRLIAHNPFAAVKVTVPRKTRNRENDAFTAEEAQTILRAATAVRDTKRAFNAAKRWVPWLCAYSGARAGEITQLRGTNVQRRGEFYVMRLLPDAGTIKTREARTVPLHEHLIEQGFIEFVEARGKGPLFYEKKGTDEQSAKDPMRPKRPRAGRTRARLAKWVRKLGITDPEVQPNHAWRDSFKQIAERSGISSRVHDVITGHSAKSVAADYGKATVEDMAAALKKFPRYET
jgi:integrase